MVYQVGRNILLPKLETNVDIANRIKEDKYIINIIRDIKDKIMIKLIECGIITEEMKVRYKQYLPSECSELKLLMLHVNESLVNNCINTRDLF